MDTVRAAVMLGDTPLTGAGVTVAVLDTGVDVEHPDLVEAIDQDGSASFSLRDDLLDRHGHGTHISGIIAGSGSASGGTYKGVAPGVRLLAYKVMEEQSGDDHGIPAAIAAALDAGADIINYSGGQRGPHRPPWKWPYALGLRDESFKAAASEGVLCVGAAGNDGHWEGSRLLGSTIRPGNLPSVLCVGATDENRRVSRASGRGPVYVDPHLRPNEVVRTTTEPLEPGVEVRQYKKPDIVLPGELRGRVQGLTRGLVSTRSGAGIHVHPLDGIDPAHPYGRMGGTSQATAVATGLAALGIEYARNVGLDLGPRPGQALIRLFQETAITLAEGDENDFGWGFVLWPNLEGTILDCAEQEVRRDAVLERPHLKLMD